MCSSDLGCKVAQGFFFARPMRPEQLHEWLHRTVLERHDFDLGETREPSD